MFDLDPRLQARLRQSLRRVLILEENPAYARMLSDMVRVLGADQIFTVADGEDALLSVEDVDPMVIFVPYASPNINGVEFTRSLRHSGKYGKATPVIMIKADITPQQLNDARNCGVHEMLAKPFAWQDLVKRLQNVLFKPRDWIEVQSYTGPDRRRFNTGTVEYKGPKKRKSEGGASDQRAALQEAARQLRAALDGFDGNEAAAMGEVMRQMAVIVPACKGIRDPRVLEAVQGLLAEIRVKPATRQGLEPQVTALMVGLGLEKAEAAA